MLLETALAFEIAVATTICDLDRLAHEWHQLWRRDSRATPFQSPAWLIPWAKHFTAGEFCCVTIRLREELVALVPTFVWQNPESHERELLLLGTGISDYTDGIFDRDHANEAASAAIAWLREKGHWDVLNFEQLPPDSPLVSHAESLESESVCPVVRLPASARQLNEVIPRGQLQNFAYYRRRAERFGKVAFEQAEERSLGRMLEELFALHSARWNQGGGPNALSDESVRSFHRKASRALLAIDALRFYCLKIGSQTAAVLYAFASHGRTYYYASGFNPEFASISPGTLIVGYAIEQAVCEGGTHVDFLRGAERYKYLWGAKDTETLRRVERRASRIEK